MQSGLQRRHMVQCEMCGAETANPTMIKVEGAELEVCSDCAEFGTEVKSQETSTTSTKYSTGSADSDSSSTSGTTSSSSSTGGSTGRSRDMFDAVDTLAQDYDDRIRQAREDRGLTQSELANELNEKASLIRKVERGETLPSDDLQSKLERQLDISLTAGGEADDTDWSSGNSTGEYTLGDVVERKD